MKKYFIKSDKAIWPGITTPNHKLNVGICTGINSLPKTLNVGGTNEPSKKLKVCNSKKI